MARTTGGTPKARLLGAELRILREHTDIGLRELARKMKMTHSRLRRWETGLTVPTPTEVATYLAHIGYNGPEVDRLATLATEASEANWYGVGVDEVLAALLEFERTATRIVDVSPLLIPGLLQTSDYARSMMKADDAPTGEIEKFVGLRLGRRDVLTRSNPVELLAVIGEAALRQPVFTWTIQADQLRYVLRCAEMPNVTVRVLPANGGWTPASMGAFSMYEFPTAAPIVHLEHIRASGFVQEAKDLGAFREATDKILRAAMSPAESAGLIADIAKEMEGR